MNEIKGQENQLDNKQVEKLNNVFIQGNSENDRKRKCLSEAAE